MGSLYCHKILTKHGSERLHLDAIYVILFVFQWCNLDVSSLGKSWSKVFTSEPKEKHTNKGDKGAPCLVLFLSPNLLDS